MKKLSLILIGFLLSSCFPYDEGPAEFPAGEVMGYKPVYTEELSQGIEFLANQPLNNPGKIYIYNSYLLINERSLGVHVVDNSDRTNPKLIGFISIPGNIDMALNGNYLIADNLSNLITIDISVLSEPKIIDRVLNAFNDNSSLPPEAGRYFECPDPKMSHLIVNWILVPLTNPKCYR